MKRLATVLRREWAIFCCASGVHVHCPCVSATPLFRLHPRTTRRDRKARP